MLIDAEWSTGDGSDSIAWREITEEFAAVVVHAAAGANDDFAVEHGRLPGYADSGTDTPLAAGERGIAYSLGAVGVVAGNDEPGLVMVSETAL